MWGDIHLYLWGVLGHWYSLVVGCLFAIGPTLERYFPPMFEWVNSHFDIERRRRAMRIIAFGAIFLSGFLAWRDEHVRSEDFRARLEKQIADESRTGFKPVINHVYFAPTSTNVDLYLGVTLVNTGVPSFARDYGATIYMNALGQSIRLLPASVEKRPNYGNEETERVIKLFEIDSSTPLDVVTTNPVEHNGMRQGWLRFVGLSGDDWRRLVEAGGSINMRFEAADRPYDVTHCLGPKACTPEACGIQTENYYAPSVR